MHFPEVPISDPFIKIFPATFFTLKLWFRLDRIVAALFLMIPLSSEVDIFPGAELDPQTCTQTWGPHGKEGAS